MVANRIRGHVLIAPDFLPFEIASVCLKKIRLHPDRRATFLEMFELASQLEIDTVGVMHGEAVRLAESAGMSVYDAAYLWLARFLDAELVTLDRKLAGVAAQSI